MHRSLVRIDDNTHFTNDIGFVDKILNINSGEYNRWVGFLIR